jgi:hypothetical protein
MMAETESNDGRQINIEIDGIHDVSGQVNVAGGHIVHAGPGATVIIGASAVAANGLAALNELMQFSRNVYDAVILFQSYFRVAYEQVESLSNYKDLHDLLHHLQFHCYNGISQAALRFPSDDLTLDNLIDYSLTLDEIYDGLNRLTAWPSMPGQELAWIEEVGLAKTDLADAIQALDEKILRKVVWRLNRLLATQPARINALLNHSARALSLPALISALSRICDTLRSLELDAKKVSTFFSGVDALAKLNETLNVLVDEHDQWQMLDVELRRIEGLIDRDLDELENSWPDVKIKAAPLCETIGEAWAEAWRRDRDLLDDALRMGNPQKSRRGFRSYQRRAIERFYRVDSELKMLCNDMRQIGTPLASVLEMIG